MIVNFDRKKALKRMLISDALGSIWIIIIFFGIILFSKFVFKSNSYLKVTLIIYTILSIFILAFNVYVSFRKAKTLVFEFEGDKHTETYEVITKTRNQARTQVVNNVNINQGLIDKFMGLFSLDVEYGFGDEGYGFTYSFLTEKQALDLEKMIKTKSKAISIK